MKNGPFFTHSAKKTGLSNQTLGLVLAKQIGL